MDDYSLTFSVPLRVKVSKKKYFILNINNYRNAHHRVLSSAKRTFTDYILDLSLDFVPFDKCKLHYRYYPASNRKYDSMNVVSVIDKFVCDALIKKGVIRDDNYKIVEFPTFTPMPPDRDNPRMEVSVERLLL